MYCGMSLARVGLDFRGLLPPVFEACILAMFSKVNSGCTSCMVFQAKTSGVTASPSNSDPGNLAIFRTARVSGGLREDMLLCMGALAASVD